MSKIKIHILARISDWITECSGRDAGGGGQIEANGVNKDGYMLFQK
jgi:hypothetical protein